MLQVLRLPCNATPAPSPLPDGYQQPSPLKAVSMSMLKLSAQMRGEGMGERHAETFRGMLDNLRTLESLGASMCVVHPQTSLPALRPHLPYLTSP